MGYAIPGNPFNYNALACVVCLEAALNRPILVHLDPLAHQDGTRTAPCG